MPGPHPSWQPDPCPPWCVREHDEHDLPLDRYHQGEPTVLSVLVSRHPEEPRGDSYEPVDLMIRLGRYVGEVVDWVAIEPVELTVPRLALTAESAGRLARHIDRLLAAPAD